VVGSCEHGNERLGPIIGGKFHDYLSDHHLLKKDSDLCCFLIQHVQSMANQAKE
jgi:hypothetical protein